MQTHLQIVDIIEIPAPARAHPLVHSVLGKIKEIPSGKVVKISFDNLYQAKLFRNALRYYQHKVSGLNCIIRGSTVFCWIDEKKGLNE